MRFGDRARLVCLVLSLALVACLGLPGIAAARVGAERRVVSDPSLPEGLSLAGESFEEDTRVRAALADAESGLSAATWEWILTGGDPAVYDVGPDTWLDGSVYNNDTTSNVRFVIAFVVWYSATDQPLSAQATMADTWILPSVGSAPFSIRLEPPPGAAYYDLMAMADTTPEVRHDLDVTQQASGIGAGGERWYTLRVTNNTGVAVVAPLVAGREIEDSGSSTWLLDNVEPDSHPDVLAPGASFDVDVTGYNALTYPADIVLFSYWGEAIVPSPKVTVYRFYNRRTGTHFYTADESEKNSVIAKLGWLYSFEGPAYTAHGVDRVDTTPLYRFYNVRTGTHFYTANPDERDDVIARLGATYAYEGPAYFVSGITGSWTTGAFRFYNRSNGVHFYTVDPGERDSVIANLGWLYTYEGPAFDVPK